MSGAWRNPRPCWHHCVPFRHTELCHNHHHPLHLPFQWHHHRHQRQHQHRHRHQRRHQQLVAGRGPWLPCRGSCSPCPALRPSNTRHSHNGLDQHTTHIRGLLRTGRVIKLLLCFPDAGAGCNCGLSVRLCPTWRAVSPIRRVSRARFLPATGRWAVASVGVAPQKLLACTEACCGSAAAGAAPSPPSPVLIATPTRSCEEST